MFTRESVALVTGAGGFVGSRLVANLLRDGVQTRSLLRRRTGRAEAPAGGHIVCLGDVTDEESVRAAASGCDTIYHCAWGGNTLADARRVNVEGTRHVLQAAAACGVRRVVHVSSMAVHGRNLPPVLTEDYPLTGSGSPYDVSKAEGERAAFELGARMGIEVVAVRPTLVYGPASPIWVVDYFRRVKREQVTLIDGGAGLANLVYVDDLVDAMRAASRMDVGGEAFLVSGASAVTWRDYLGSFAAMCGKPLPPTLSRSKARLELLWTRPYSLLASRARRVQAMDLGEMTQHTEVSIQKARTLLGYEPRVSLAEGMRRSERWLRQMGHLGVERDARLGPEQPRPAYRAG